MFQLKLLLIGLTALCVNFGTAQGETQVNCYYGNWANYRPGLGKFVPENIDPFLCTSVGYSFLGINDDGGVRHLDTWLDLDLGYIAKTVALKKKNPKLKVLMVVGGWNEGSTKYSQVAASSTKRKNFIESAVKMMQQFGFDGLDLDWEYPADRGGAPNDKDNFVIFLKEIYQALKPLKLVFSIAVGATEKKALSSYDIPKIAQNVDFVNLMTYDFNSADDHFAGSNAPLEGPGPNNVKASVEYWLSHGFPAQKLIMGLPFYGRRYTLASSAQHKLGDPITGAGAPGPYTKQGGFLGYNEICPDINKYTREWSDKEKSAYLFNQNDFITYDDTQSIAEKVAYGRAKKLGGFMIWSIETDDFNGVCGTKNPLLKAINNGIGNPQDMSSSGNELPKVTSSSDETPPSETSNNNPRREEAGDCSVDGFYANKDDCSAYIRCVGGIRYDQKCPSGLHFDTSSDTCNYPSEVKCK